MKTGRKALVFLFIVTVSRVCSAQMHQVTVSGTISDTSGAFVPGTQVTALQTDTQATASTVSNTSGMYEFLGLRAGDYTFTAEKAGFKKATQHMVLITAADVRVDFTLEVGGGLVQVEVKGIAPMVAERTTALGVALEPQHMVDLPLAVNQGRRTPYSYLAAVPGVENAGFADNVNGSVGMYNEMLVDGLGAEYNPAVAGVINGPPSIEVIDEFKVETSTNAEYGLTGGGFISMGTKSGTNTVHGSAFEYLRNNALDSRYWFAPKRDTYKQSEAGFTLGGPVYIPRVYDGRNKAFFFVNFNVLDIHNAVGGTVLSVPTRAMKAGDLSAFLGPQIGTDNLGRPVLSGQIYDPNTSRDVTAGQVDPVTGRVATGTGLVRDPFSNNLIPSTQFSSVSNGFQSHIPDPNVANLLANNGIYSGTVSIFREFSSLEKIDYLTPKGRLSVNHGWLRTPPYVGSHVLPAFFGPTNHWVRNNHVRVDYTRTLSPATVEQFLFGVNRTNQFGGIIPGGEHSASTIGLTGVFVDCAPWVVIAQYGTWGPNGCKQQEADTNWKLQDNIHMLRGKHSIAFGGSYYTWNANFPTQDGGNGPFNFLPGETGLPGTAFANQTGVGYASFLLGAVDNARVQAPFEKGLRSWYMGVFIQDEYRATSKLTLNAGLRWEWQPNYTELHGTATSFNPLIPNPKAGGLPGALEFLGVGPGRNGKSNFGHTYGKEFGPRLGFAYKLTPSTVLRGSYGLFWAPVSQWSGEFAYRAGFRPTFSVSSGNSGRTPAFNWTSGFPLGRFNINPVTDPTIANGSGTSWYDPSEGYPPPEAQIINFSVQHQLRGDMLLEVAYAGNLTHHVGSGDLEEINQLDFGKYGGLGSLLNADISSPQAVAAGIKVPFPGFSGSVAQALRPYPQYEGINGISPSIGNSLYHGVQIKLQKKFVNGLSFLVGETIAKELNDVAGYPAVFASGVQNAYNRAAEKSFDSATPFPSHLVMSYAYELPFGPGKRFLNHSDVISKHVLGGWTIGGIHTYASGHPLRFSTNQRLPTTGDSSQPSSPSLLTIRPNFAPGATIANLRSSVSCGNFDPYKDRYFNSGVLVDPANFTFGNLAPTYGSVRSCASYNEDISLGKSFPLKREGAKLKIGFDFFNILNRHNWGGPDTNIDDTSFGQIGSASGARYIQIFARIDF